MVEAIKTIFTQVGVDICGVANVEAFKNAPYGFRPSDIYADCRSVIVFAKPLPRGCMLVNPRIVYNHYGEIVKAELDRIAYTAANRIEAEFSNAVAVPLPCDNPYEYWVAETMEGRGILSMKHAAVLAGLGTLGKNTLLMNRQFGNMLYISAVLTNLDLPTDPPAEMLCPKSCHICIDNCPAHAISESGVNQLLCRQNAYAKNGRGFSVTNCNICRIRCPRAFGCDH